jgi:hypothetical protein
VKCEDDLSRIHASFTDGKFGFVPWDAFILELKILACSFGLNAVGVLALSFRPRCASPGAADLKRANKGYLRRNTLPLMHMHFRQPAPRTPRPM